MAASALASALAKKLASDQLRIMDALTLAEPKTKELGKILNNLTRGKSTLLVIDHKDKAFIRAGANLAKNDVVSVRDLSVYDVLTHAFVVMDTKVMSLLEKSYE